MRIAILTSGILPVPAVQGGAAETLVDLYLEYNSEHRLHDITVYSVGCKDIPAGYGDSHNHYVYIDTSSLTAKIRKRLFRLTHKDLYYHFSIEYYLHKALKHIRRGRYDVIVIENRPGFALSIPRDTGAKTVLHLHNDFLNTTVRNGREIFDRLSRILCVSDYIAGRVNTIRGNIPGKTVTVHNGIDVTAFSPSEAKPVERKLLGLDSNDFVLIFCGRINKEKGISELIDAMIALKKHENIKLLVLGSSFYGNDESGNEFINSLKEKAEPIKDRIIFTGFIPYKDIPSYLAIADVAAIPSVWDDPFPTSVLEAQAMGLPVLTTVRGGIPEEVTSDNAVMLDTGNSFCQRLADEIINLRNDIQRRKSMSAASLRRASLFTKERYAADFFKALTDL